MYKEIAFEQNYNRVLNINTPSIPPEIRTMLNSNNNLPEIIFITSYPPRECGIATYSEDLIKQLNKKFHDSFSLKVCALESENMKRDYPSEVSYTLDTGNSSEYSKLAHTINKNKQIKIVLIQHEFGFFQGHEEDFFQLIYTVNKPIIVAFHTVLPDPDEALKIKIKNITAACEAIVVMTNNAAQVLINDYHVPAEKIVVIPHGTHLVPHLDKNILKEKYNLTDKKVLSTFGLLSSGKSIETTLDALPTIIKIHTNVMFLIIGKTHPSITKQEGENYREMLEAKVLALQLQNHVRFINRYLPLPELLEYLQLTDVYLFTSNDPHQAVSGTFSYAMSAGCPIVSTPIPHALEVLHDEAGIVFDFGNTKQLGEAVNRLLGDEALRNNIHATALQITASTAWENSAIAHALLFENVANKGISLNYSIPAINLDHLKKMTTDFGIIQFSIINQPDIDSGFTLDDNARALIAVCQHYELTEDKSDLPYINTYFNFIKYCQQSEGYFLNYVDSEYKFTAQNNETNLADANGRAIWALGYLIAMSDILPQALITDAEKIMQQALLRINTMLSTRAMAFAIKGLHYRNKNKQSSEISLLIKTLANRLVQMYRHESDKGWEWYESYLTYANSILPEALLCAYSEIGDELYKEIAKNSFDFLLAQIMTKDGIKVISNKSWLHKGAEAAYYGEQPIDIAYTILALSRFYEEFKDEDYRKKMETAFNWFLGQNHLHQIIYNPCTGGCYDGLEENNVNLNQGAESTLSYLMARLTLVKYFPSIAPLTFGESQIMKLLPEHALKPNKQEQFA
jgi:glycosyltransferase involved in cell wall biosynthesis